MWPVNDISTALLISEFYRKIVIDQKGPAQALKEAQLWLKESKPITISSRLSEMHTALKASVDEFKKHSNEVTEKQLKRLQENLKYIELKKNSIAYTDNEEPPYENQYFWAGFVIHGWGF